MPYADPAKANQRRRERYYANLDYERARKRGRPQAARKAYQQWKARHPDGLWKQWLKKAHGMAPEQWFAMWASQDGNCYICERPLPEDRSQVVIDHDHECCEPKRSCGYCRRGLTHKGCNGWVGMLGSEDIDLMRRALANFERAQAQTKALIMSKPEQGELPLRLVSGE